MSQITPVTSCTHTPFGHLLHPLCPAQSELKRVANIVVPLFIVLGAIYYGWRYFNPVVPPEEQSNTRIPNIEVPKSNEGVPLNESDSESHLNGTSPLDESDDFQSEPVKTPEEIFDAHLRNKDLESARKIMRGLSFEMRSRGSDTPEVNGFRQRLIDTALGMKSYEEAFKDVLELNDETARKTYFARLASNIAANIKSFKMIFRETLRYSAEKNKVLGEIVDILIDNDHLSSALEMSSDLMNWGDGDPYFEKIFNAFLEKKEIALAKTALKKIQIYENTVPLRPFFIQAAIEKGECIFAAEGAYDTRDVNIRNGYFDRIAPKIAENPLWVSKRWDFPMNARDLYERVILLLIEKRNFTDAKTWTDKIWDLDEKKALLDKIKDAESKSKKQ